MNLDLDQVGVYRSPGPDRSGYGSVSHIGSDRTPDVAGLPGVSFPASAVIGLGRRARLLRVADPEHVDAFGARTDGRRFA